MIAMFLALAFAIMGGIAAIGRRNRGRAALLPVPVRVPHRRRGVGER